jgi:hypothetical protein
VKINSRDLPDENPLDLEPLKGATITSAKFYPYDKVVLTFDTGDVVTIAEERQDGDISVDLSNWALNQRR